MIANVVMNPTNDQYDEMENVGEKNTFPFMSRIRSQCCIEHALDRYIVIVRTRPAIANVMLHCV